eukprot:GHVU01155130.1.p1 GENE.GHVU01155130.1~~GHVU01155130.1.p1  ORF type:complete len:218 (+),score=23.56 GHVU01155130.1:384-1037(+)
MSSVHRCQCRQSPFCPVVDLYGELHICVLGRSSRSVTVVSGWQCLECRRARPSDDRALAPAPLLLWDHRNVMTVGIPIIPVAIVIPILTVAIIVDIVIRVSSFADDVTMIVSCVAEMGAFLAGILISANVYECYRLGRTVRLARVSTLVQEFRQQQQEAEEGKEKEEREGRIPRVYPAAPSLTTRRGRGKEGERASETCRRVSRRASPRWCWRRTVS